ncbi:MAG: hypothetical protein ACYC2U_02720 [Candidatus Amoebophilus sp.]
MSGPKLTQTELLNVLVSEIESFKTTKKAYNDIAQETSQHLKRLEDLYNKPISVDTEAMRQEHVRIQQTLHKGLYIPRWLGISYLCLVIALGISLCFNYKHYFLLKDGRNYINELDLYVKELKEKTRKPNTKR